MTLLAWILVALGAAALALDAYAIRKVFTSSFYDPGQRWAQTALIPQRRGQVYQTVKFELFRLRKVQK